MTTKITKNDCKDLKLKEELQISELLNTMQSLSILFSFKTTR